MADVEEPQFTTLAERIAALNKQKNFKAPEVKAKRAPPPPPPFKADKQAQALSSVPTVAATQERPIPTIPPRPSRALPPKANPPPLPRRTTESPQVQPQHSPAARDRVAPPPQILSRSATSHNSPALPPRRPSTQTQYLEARRNSNASEISTLSSLSLNNNTVSSATSIHSVDGAGRKLPPAFDPSSLPPLPPTKRERDAQAAKEAVLKEPARPRAPIPIKSAPAIRQIEAPQRPTLPPRLSNASAVQQNHTVHQHAPDPELPPAKPRRLPPPASEAPAVRPIVRPQPVTNGHEHHVQDIQGHSVPSQASDDYLDERDVPPPIPLSSRPTIPQPSATAAQQAPAVQQRDDCLTCRDFSGPDGVAAQYPRESLPRDDPVGYLAHYLCAPFASHTDKARAIFTWFHHNIAYDCPAFFGNSIRAHGAEETIQMGRAVCSGYADTYKAIAERAGLECITVTGHGKGIGHTALKKGERPPPKKADGHAWNAVRIDGGEWKLLDSCWGAGNVSSATKSYTPSFKPEQFTRSNEMFGLSHYPEDNNHFFRSDGRIPTWEEYYIGPVHGETPTVYTNAHLEGIEGSSVYPQEKQISVNSGECVRFQFSKLCEHWTSERHGLGKPPLLLLSIGGRDGRKKEMVPMETDGYWWWLDVNAIDLGAPGEGLSIFMVTKFDGKDGRGLSKEEFLAKRGRVGMAFAGIIKWDLI
ncbi:hypothetical protein BN1708_006079 [Verticillium longisporum]|uniref:Transglutaminase-like domain-containing protein n=1 Tax=Verticillium longisporum TaxID=100787 RepID=A0A0G4MHB7_VERLO|nr:hypothetical protein BN1708_006079 [Verticillium longisporum]